MILRSWTKRRHLLKRVSGSNISCDFPYKDTVPKPNHLNKITSSLSLSLSFLLLIHFLSLFLSQTSLNRSSRIQKQSPLLIRNHLPCFKMTGFSVSLIVSNLSNVASYLSPIFETIPSTKVVPAQIEKVVSLVSRTGRDLQRYDNAGYRQVVGYVKHVLKSFSPYRCSFRNLIYIFFKILFADAYRTDTRNNEAMGPSPKRSNFSL